MFGVLEVLSGGGIVDSPLTSSVFHEPMYIMVMNLQKEVIALLV